LAFRKKFVAETVTLQNFLKSPTLKSFSGVTISTKTWKGQPGKDSMTRLLLWKEATAAMTALVYFYT
jgi:hypothetical protein